MRVNLGSGTRKRRGWVNVDINAKHDPDVVADLDERWPWGGSAVYEIYARDLFEHVADPVHFMTELHRVLVTNGLATIIVPHFMSADAFTDPTHKRFCTPDTLNFWLPGTPQYEENNYGGVAFALESRETDPTTGKIKFRIRKAKL